MKRWKGALLACLLCAAAFGGVGHMDTDAAARDAAKSAAPPVPAYSLVPLVREESRTADDGTLLVECAYRLVELQVDNQEALSAEDAQWAQQVAEDFNGRVAQRLEDAAAFGQELEDMAREAYAAGFFTLPYADELSASAVRQGNLCSIRLDAYSYSGGAHPNTYTDSYLFDLEAGQFIGPAQVADDPVALQRGAAELLLEKAREQDKAVQMGYYPEYAEIIASWYEGTVLFDSEGMTVVYSPYELGPYALGAVELKAGYGELRELLGPGGLERLGLAEGE